MARVTVENIKIDEYGKIDGYGLYLVVKVAARVATTLAQGSGLIGSTTVHDNGFKSSGNKDPVNALRLLEAGIEDPKAIELSIIESMRKKKIVEENTDDESVGGDDEFFNDISASDIISEDFSDFADIPAAKVEIDDDIFSDDNDI